MKIAVLINRNAVRCEDVQAAGAEKLVAVTYVSNIIGEGYRIEWGGLIYLQILAFML
jgi:hypothetical protein